MFKTGLKRYEYANLESFTSNVGLKVRKSINPVFFGIVDEWNDLRESDGSRKS